MDASKPLSAEIQRELYQALLDYEVLFLPAQVLSADNHVALASVFGTIASGAYFPRKDGNANVEITEFDDNRPPDLNNWHSDVTWLGKPPTGTVIQLTELPEAGGNTAWASMTKAFDALSAGFKDYLRGLTATRRI